MAKKTTAPILNTLELLLQGHPEEFLEIRTPDRPESDRAAMRRAARNWCGNEHLRPDERARIQAVWLDGHYRPPLNVNRERREELRALVQPVSRPRGRQERPTAEQLQAAMTGGEG